MRKLYDLENSLIALGYMEAASRVSDLIKLATISGIRTLGLKYHAAQLFNRVAGDKWDYVVAKWFIEYNLLQGSFQEYRGGLFGDKNDIIQNLKAINACEELLSKPIEQRKSYCEKDIDCRNLKNWLRAMDLNIESAWEKGEMEEWEMRYSRRERAMEPDEVIGSWMEELKDNIYERIESFTKEDFMKEILSGKFISPAIAKKISFDEAREKWFEKKSVSMPTVLEVGEGWKWVDAGGGRSSWVAKNLKNCGSVSWGNMRATKESGSKARMLILMDNVNKPHAMVTWNPEYVDYERDDKPPIKYLGHIEGVAGSALKPEYYPYFTQLVNNLNPDKIVISNKVEYDRDYNKIADNDQLKELIAPEKLEDR